MKRIKAVLWDMDGTVLDTLEDLTDSVNKVLDDNGFPKATQSQIRARVGNGSLMLIKRCLPEDVSEADLDRIHSQYREYYRAHLLVKTHPYDGIPELIARLKAAGIKNAVVSNKPHASTKKLANDVFGDLFDFVTGQRAGIPKKPSKYMVQYALDKMGVPAENAAFIGDSEVDVKTAINSGVRGIAVTWGFRDVGQLTAAGAKLVAKDPVELERLILGEADQ